MSLLRRWFDPIRSSWFYQKPSRQAVLPTENGLSIYLRLDDVYSYLAVQQLSQLDEILSDELKPLKIIISHTASEPPNSMTHEEWQHYCLNDAKILANQHRFAFDEFPEIPSQEALKQAAVILKRTPLQGQNFFHLLEDIFHMLWQQQYGKLRTLHAMAVKHQMPQHFPERIFTDEPVQAAYFEFGGRKYHAVDDLLRLTRRLKQQKLLTGIPIFLIIALEDPMSWLLLAYIKEELADYYDIQLKVYPLSYRGRDWFDWSLATRVSKRTEVAFTPFCRPTEESTLEMAKLFYSVPENQQLDAIFTILQAVWTKGKDPSFQKHFQQLQQQLGIEHLTEQDVPSVLEQNDALCKNKHQPDLPVLELRIDGQSYVFNSLYRVWMIESIFSNVLEEKYKTASTSN